MARAAIAIGPNEAEEARSSREKLSSLLSEAFRQALRQKPAGVLVEDFPNEKSVTIWVEGRPTSRMEDWEADINAALFRLGLPVGVIVRGLGERNEARGG